MLPARDSYGWLGPAGTGTMLLAGPNDIRMHFPRFQGENVERNLDRYPAAHMEELDSERA